MSKLSDLTSSLQETTRQQAENSKESVKSALESHEHFIKSMLQQSKKRIESDIHVHNRQSRRLLLNSWKLAGLTFLLLSLVASGLIWYQGKLIDDRWDTIRTQNKTIENLKDQTWGIDLEVVKGRGRHIILPKDQKYRDIGTFQGRPVIRLLAPED